MTFPITPLLLLFDNENNDWVTGKEDQDSERNTELHVGRKFSGEGYAEGFTPHQLVFEAKQ